MSKRTWGEQTRIDQSDWKPNEGIGTIIDIKLCNVEFNNIATRSKLPQKKVNIDDNERALLKNNDLQPFLVSN